MSFESNIYSAPATPGFGSYNDYQGQFVAHRGSEGTANWPRAGPLSFALVTPQQSTSTPPTTASPHTQANEHEIAETFGTIVQRAQEGDLELVGQLAEMSLTLDSQAKRIREEELRDSLALHRVKRSKPVSDLCQESALWKLLYWLHGDPAPEIPGGVGAPALYAAGGSLLTQHKVAKLLSSDEKLNKVARVVAWLEQLAGEELDLQEWELLEFKGYSTSFTDRQGLPMETRDNLQSRVTSDAANSCSHLDPDACTRQGKSWNEMDVKNDARITEHIWKLLQAGRMREAQQVCHSCGQSWRTASLGGPLGPRLTPVGPHADEDANLNPNEAQETLAMETDVDGAVLRQLWRQSCFQASQMLQDDKSEAAIYGLLGGNLAAVLPLCTTWHQKLWALCRNWLELEIDDSLKQPHAEPQNLLSSRSLVRSWDAIHDSLGVPLTVNATLSAEQQSHLLQWSLIEGFEQDTFQKLLTSQLPALLSTSKESGPAGDLEVEQSRKFRVAAHLSLALVDLGLIPEPSIPNLDTELVAIQEGCENLIAKYTELMVQQRRYNLVPCYACRLPKEARREVCCKMLVQLTQEGDVATQQAIFEQLDVALHERYSQEQGDVEEDELAQIAEMVAGTTRWVPGKGPALKADAAAWLWKSPETFLLSLRHSNALLREFALGNSEGVKAAALLLSNIPAEVQTMLRADFQALESTAEWMSVVEIYGEDALPLIKDELGQLKAWSAYVDLYRRYETWMGRYEAISGEEGSKTLKSLGKELLKEHIGFLRSEDLNGGSLLDFLETPQSEEQGHRMMILMAKSQTEQEYEGWREDQCSQIVAQIEAQLHELQTSLTNGDQLQSQVTASSSEVLGSLIKVEVAANSLAALEGVVSFLSLLLKGHLTKSLDPLVVVNLEGHESPVTLLCRNACFARHILHAAQLCLAVECLGVSEPAGEDLVNIVAGDGQYQNYVGLTPYLTQVEIQELLELERRKAVQHKLNQATNPEDALNSS